MSKWNISGNWQNTKNGLFRRICQQGKFLTFHYNDSGNQTNGIIVNDTYIEESG